MYQVLFRIPIPGVFPDGLPIYGFGMMLFVAFIVCTWLAGRLGRREGITNEVIQDVAIWVFVGGLLGARVTYLLSHETFTGVGDFLWKLPKIWEGGIVLYGSILGGFAAYVVAHFLYFRAYQKIDIPMRRLIDALAPTLALGIAFGRFGCLLNGCCFGGVACAASLGVTPVTFPMCAPPRESLVYQGFQTSAGFSLDPGGTARGARVAAVDPLSAAYGAGLRPGAIITEVNGNAVVDNGEVNAYLGDPGKWPRGRTVLDLTFRPDPDSEPVTESFAPRTLGLYPTQLYEVVSMVLLTLILLAYRPVRKNPGQVCAVLMVCYGLHRYLNEILRDDPRPEGFEKYGSVVLVIAGTLLWLWLQAKTKEPEATPIVEG